MMYCVSCETIRINPAKVSSIKEAYGALDDHNDKPIELFDSLDDAMSYVSDAPTFHGCCSTFGEATVYIIRECDWCFDDEYYRNPDNGEIEHTFDDLESLGTEYLFADESSFLQFKYGATGDTTERDFEILAEVKASFSFNKNGHICRYDGDVYFVEMEYDRDNKLSATMYDSFETCCKHLNYEEVDDLGTKVYVKDVGYKMVSELV